MVGETKSDVSTGLITTVALGPLGMLGFLNDKHSYTFNLNGYDQYGNKNSLNIHFLNDKPAKKFIREIELVSGLALGQRRSAKQIRENELLYK